MSLIETAGSGLARSGDEEFSMRITFIAASILAMFSATAAANATIVSGELHCSIQGGFGFVIASDRQVTCTFRRPGLPVEFYTGRTSNLGLDLGPTNARSVAYRVLSADVIQPGALQGAFEGPGIAVGPNVGLAANALVGPGGIALLPITNITITMNTGFNVTAGINGLTLDFAGLGHSTRYSNDLR